MKTKTTLLVIALTTMICSCGSPRIYTTGSYAAMKSYTEKPLYKGEKETATYVSGDIAFGSHEQEDGDFKDSKTLFSGRIHRSTSGKFYNYYYGAGLSAGSYKFKEGYSNLIDDGEKKAFYNVNLKAGFNINYNRPKVEWRFIGFEFTYLNEFGPYQNKLNNLVKSGDNGFDVINVKSLFAYNIYSEYVFKSPKDDTGLLLGFYFGDLLNNNDENHYYNSTYYNGFVLGLIREQYTISLITEAGGRGLIKSFKFGLTYKL